jgi:hypothetical protein
VSYFGETSRIAGCIRHEPIYVLGYARNVISLLEKVYLKRYAVPLPCSKIDLGSNRLGSTSAMNVDKRTVFLTVTGFIKDTLVP